MIKKIQCILKQRDESSSQSLITLQIGSVHLTDEKQLEKKVNIIEDMFGCWIFNNVEYLRSIKLGYHGNVHTYKGYKTRQNYEKAITYTQRLD